MDITCSGTLQTSVATGFSNLGLQGLDGTASIWSDGEISLNHVQLDALSSTLSAGNSLLLASDVKLPTPYPVTSGMIVRNIDVNSGRLVLAAIFVAHKRSAI